MNIVILEGRASKDAEVKTTTTGKKVVTLNVATNEKIGDKEHTEWHTVTCWGWAADQAELVLKGNKVLIHGHNRTRSWEAEDGTKKYKTEVNAETVARVPVGEKEAF